jgi:hypothetical protein
VEDGTAAEVGIDVQPLASEARRKSLKGELARRAILEGEEKAVRMRTRRRRRGTAHPGELLG